MSSLGGSPTQPAPAPKREPDDATFRAICERVSRGEPLTAICRAEGMPSYATVLEWLRGDPESDDELRERLAMWRAAKQAGHDHLAEECLAIADDSSQDTIRGPRGGEVLNGEWVARSKIRIDTRLRLLSYWDRARYGTHMTVAGDPEAPLAVQVLALAPTPPKATDAE